MANIEYESIRVPQGAVEIASQVLVRTPNIHSVGLGLYTPTINPSLLFEADLTHSEVVATLSSLNDLPLPHQPDVEAWTEQGRVDLSNLSSSSQEQTEDINQVIDGIRNTSGANHNRFAELDEEII